MTSFLRKDRINSIDVLRGISVILMIIGHIYYIWPEVNNGLFGDTILFIVLVAPAFFLLISGISFYLFLSNNIDKKDPKIKIFNEVIKRSLFIFIISTIFQILFGSVLNMQITCVIYWSIFQVIALSMILFFIIPFLKYYIRLFLYFSIFLILFIINFIVVFYEMIFLYIFVINGPFPFIPWSNFFIFGLFIGDLLRNSQKEQIKWILFNFLLVGFIFFLIWVIWGIKISTGYISIFLKSYFIFLILFSVCYFYLDIKELDLILSRRLIQWGKTAFTLYYIQFIFVAGGLVLFPLVFNKTKMNSLLICQFFIVITIILFALELFLRLWHKFEYKFGIEWFMNKFTTRSLLSPKTE